LTRALKKSSKSGGRPRGKSCNPEVSKMRISKIQIVLDFVKNGVKYVVFLENEDKTDKRRVELCPETEGIIPSNLSAALTALDKSEALAAVATEAHAANIEAGIEASNAE
jgi:hypothetical protein